MKIVSSVEGKMQLSRQMSKSGISVVYTDKNIPKNSTTISFLSEKEEVKINPSISQQATMYSAIIPKGVTNIVIERDRTGLGDTISILSAIQQMRIDYPSVHITYRAWKPYLELLKNHPDIDVLEDCLTVERKEIEDKSSEVFIDLSSPCPAGVYESSTQSQTNKSRNEIFTNACGLRWRNERPILHLTEDEQKFGLDYVFSKTDQTKSTIGLVLRSAEPWKDWPYVEEFSEQYLDKYNILTIDKTMMMDIDGVINLALEGFSLREMISTLPYMDCVLSPDTGIMHICDALDVPCLSLFGSMIGSFYKTKYDNSLSVIQGKCIHDKPPCFYEVCEGKANYQPCMSSIKPEFVESQIRSIINSGSIIPPNRLINQNVDFISI